MPKQSRRFILGQLFCLNFRSNQIVLLRLKTLSNTNLDARERSEPFFPREGDDKVASQVNADL